MYFKYIFYKFLWYHLLCFLVCFIVWKLYIMHNSDFSANFHFTEFYERKSPVLSVLTEDCNIFFLFCNRMVKFALPSFIICPNSYFYLHAKIQDFLPGFLIKNWNFYDKFKERGRGPYAAFLYVCVNVCSLNYNHTRKKAYSFAERSTFYY